MYIRSKRSSNKTGAHLLYYRRLEKRKEAVGDTEKASGECVEWKEGERKKREEPGGQAGGRTTGGQML